MLQVRDPNVLRNLGILNLKMPANGFFYVYTNNESNVKVYFNDLTILHTTSVLKEENHFYPYGLLMEGITPVVAANGSINKYKFSDSELQLELGLNQYDFSARFYDPVIGRFNVIDPFADFAANFTSYRYAFDNPVSYNDPSGLWEEDDDRGNDDLDLRGGPPGDKMQGQSFPPGTFREFEAPVEKMDRIEARIDIPEREMEIVENMDGAGATKESANKSDWNDEYDDRDEEDSGDDDVEEAEVYDGTISNVGDFLYELNKFNPIANLYNGISGFITGHDSYGVSTNNTQATINILCAIPIGKFGRVTEEIGAGLMYELRYRLLPGGDGGVSRHIIEKLDGSAISRTHQVFLEGKIIHQHQTHIGAYGTERIFPGEWIMFPTIK